MHYERLVIIVLSLVVIFLVARILCAMRSIRQMANSLQEVSLGSVRARFFITGKCGLERVAAAIRSLMEKVYKRLDTAEQERQRMEAILRGMSDSVLITDTKGMILLANRTFRKLLSIQERVEGKQIMEVVRDIHLMEMWRQALDSWEIISEEIVLPRDNSEVYAIATVVPVYSEHSVAGTVLTLHDITRLKRLEVIRKDFVANVSHEIKTPITAIKGFAETLLDGALEDRDNALTFLKMIQNHSERLNSLVNDLLTLSGIELGDITIERSSVNLEEIIDTVFATLKDKAEKKGLFLGKALSEDKRLLYADKDKLVQILLNLVDNGIKFTEKGGVTVGVTEGAGRVVIYVQDTGTGIPQKHLQRLGERFYRVDRARSRELGGTGLGLAIVKHLVSGHNWNMEIESEQGKGTKVIIRT